MKIEKTAPDTITVSGSIGDTAGGILSAGIILTGYFLGLLILVFIGLFVLVIIVLLSPLIILAGIGYGIYKAAVCLFKGRGE